MSGNKVVVGVYQSKDIPQSFRVYAANILKYFNDLDIEVIAFSDSGSLPKSADVIWDIRSGGGNPPIERMLGKQPLVVTVHGFAPTSLSGWEYFKSVRGMLMTKRWAKEKADAWSRMKAGVSNLIAVSEFSRREAADFTGVELDRIAVCHHGVEHEHFFASSDDRKEKYFLHVSNNEPRKNVDRIVQAFRRLPRNLGIELVLKLPAEEARRYQRVPGVRIVAGFLSTEELAELYRRSIGFVFPSLYEGFGLPILEAMACGCPVITSTETACPEVAGNAALLVDPRDEIALRDAMKTLATDKDVQRRLTAAGLDRVKVFDWKTSAACHARILRHAAEASSSQIE